MIEASNIALVRHGRYDTDGHLNELGKHQADLAAASLVADHGFSSAVILTSSAPRALETAERIAVEVGVGTIVIPHLALQEAGECPEGMRNLRTLANAVIEASAPSLEYDDHLVIVSHLPLIAAMMEVENVGNGEVCLYNGDGQNPVYEPGFAATLDAMLPQPPVL